MNLNSLIKPPTNTVNKVIQNKVLIICHLQFDVTETWIHLHMWK